MEHTIYFRNLIQYLVVKTFCILFLFCCCRICRPKYPSPQKQNPDNAPYSFTISYLNIWNIIKCHCRNSDYTLSIQTTSALCETNVSHVVACCSHILLCPLIGILFTTFSQFSMAYWLQVLKCVSKTGLSFFFDDRMELYRACDGKWGWANFQINEYPYHGVWVLRVYFLSGALQLCQLLVPNSIH